MDDIATIAFLGTGIMGEPMARNLAKAGFRLRVWNRTREKAEPLAADGAVICDTPAQAAQGADALVTMLTDGAAVAATLEGGEGVFATLPTGALWLQMSTVGVAACDELAEYAAGHGIAFVDAPVLGTRAPAEQAALVVLASGDPSAVDRAHGIFEAIGSTTIRLGEQVGAASRLKLVINSWVLAVDTAVGEAFALAEALGVEPQAFLDAIEGGSLDCEYAHLKGKLIAERTFPPSFPVAGAHKDLSLIVEAAESAGAHLRLAAAAREQMKRTIDLGHGDEDMAAVYYAATPEATPAK